ncbi:SDR family NAD(P)-dependent oxidoreductase [Amycolatopsis sp. NPDC059021]|uniref:SDR family NAD(P)-dependent oxidoreductase n=1 Tax=Amycolatopsis sp. NPDC059021 TaxID=3346704 RepID=UPI003672B085
MKVVVTGASSGFGAAIARRFAAEGAEVIGAARRTERLATLDGVRPLELDVRDRVAAQRALAALDDVDVLVNNAGLALGLEPANAASLDDWDRMIDTNCKGLVYCTHALLPGMVERGRGHVVTIGSVAAGYAYPGANVYGASKAFARQFSLNLRSDLHGTGVRVTCVEPGLAGGTEFSEVRFHGDRDRAREVYEGVRPLTPEDIAEAVYWVATQPAHVNVNLLEVMPVAQSPAAPRVHRS